MQIPGGRIVVGGRRKERRGQRDLGRKVKSSRYAIKAEANARCKGGGDEWARKRERKRVKEKASGRRFEEEGEASCSEGPG